MRNVLHSATRAAARSGAGTMRRRFRPTGATVRLTTTSPEVTA